MLANAAKGVCDLIWVIDTTDPESLSMSRLLKRFGPIVDVAGLTYDEAAEAISAEHPDGILALADSLLVWTSEVAARLDLPFHSRETANRLTDKFAQRSAFQAGELPVPGFWLIDDADAESSLDRIKAETTFPAVVKPRRGEGSRDTLPVSSFDDLLATYARVRESTAGISRDFVVEEFIPDVDFPIGGEDFAGYVSVESFVQDGQVTHLAVTGRTPGAPPFRETGLFVPSGLAENDKLAVLDTAGRAAAAIGIRLGTLHTEIKLTPSGPVVIEVNGRIGGGIPEILEASIGVGILPLAFRIALGETVHQDPLPAATRVGYYMMVQAPASLHRVTAVEGLDALGAVNGVADISLNRGNGKEVDWRDGNTGNVFTMSGSTADLDEFRHLLVLIDELVDIRGE
jgi:hypothetical protein